MTEQERIAKLERQLNEARSRIQTLLDDNANEHTEWLHYRAQARELGRQLAAEREARQKAEAACAVQHAMLDELLEAGRKIWSALLLVLGDKAPIEVFRCPTCPDRGPHGCDSDCPMPGGDELAVEDALAVGKRWFGPAQ